MSIMGSTSRRHIRCMFRLGASSDLSVCTLSCPQVDLPVVQIRKCHLRLRLACPGHSGDQIHIGAEGVNACDEIIEQVAYLGRERNRRFRRVSMMTMVMSLWRH